MAGASDALPRAIYLPISGELPAGGARTEFLRAIVDGGSVTVIGERDSSALRALASANALIERPAGCPAAADRTPVPVYLLGNGGIA
jgi:molybdopterin molybdotransferase